MEKEIRNITNQLKRANADSRRVEGLAIVFNADSNDMGFVESIEPTAITNETIGLSDVFCYLNHQDERGCLARCNHGTGSLDLWIESDGLHYAFDAPKTQLGDELLSYLERGEITSSSFAFTIAEGGDEWKRGENGLLRRTIKKIDKLFDVSPVFQPAYSTTSAVRRKLDLSKDVEEKLNALADYFSD